MSLTSCTDSPLGDKVAVLCTDAETFDTGEPFYHSRYPYRMRGNAEILAQHYGWKAVVIPRQTHSTHVLTIDEDTLSQFSWEYLPEADGLVTTCPGVALAVRVADCMPIVLADGDNGVIGVAHAGRVGLLDGILPVIVEQMRVSGARHISALLGPHICASCYEVSPEMAEEISHNWPEIVTVSRWGTPSIDLASGASLQLASLGVSLTRRDPCTLTTETLESYRRDGEDSGRLATFVWMPTSS